MPADSSVKSREQCPPPTADLNIPGITAENVVPNRGRRLEHLATLASLAGENRISGIPGWHVAGDGALDVLTQTYRAHMPDDRIRQLRIQADHCFGVRQDQIELAARLGQTFSCNFDTENTKIIEEDYGEEYLTMSAPVASMLKKGVNVVIGTFGNYGRLRASPFEDGIAWLTRKDENGDPWGVPEYAVADDDAIRRLSALERERTRFDRRRQDRRYRHFERRLPGRPGAGTRYAHVRHDDQRRQGSL
jgi:predicted amidohydrolase YtcJ